MRPSSVRPAAPTRNFEYGAYACSVAAMAAARRAAHCVCVVAWRVQFLSDGQPTIIVKTIVGTLQAFIFTILTAVYIGGAMHPEH